MPAYLYRNSTSGLTYSNSADLLGAAWAPMMSIFTSELVDFIASIQDEASLAFKALGGEVGGAVGGSLVQVGYEGTIAVIAGEQYKVRFPGLEFTINSAGTVVSIEDDEGIPNHLNGGDFIGATAVALLVALVAQAGALTIGTSLLLGAAAAIG